jgi:general secretion pathway protein E
VRTLCAHCKIEVPFDERGWLAMTANWKLPPPQQNFGPKGCTECRKTGFQGRTGIYEMMRISAPLRALIQPNMDLAAVTATALGEGMRPLRVSAAAQVARGVTTLREVMNVLPPIE